LVCHDQGEAILKQDHSAANRAKRASSLHVLIGGSDSSKVRVIPVSLHRVATVAECLKVAHIVPASFDSRRYVVHFQRTFVSRDTAKFAAELGVLEDFITNPAEVSLWPQILSNGIGIG
jgi:hypothetical protein